MTSNRLTYIPHTFRASSRFQFVQTLRLITADEGLCPLHGKSQREVARALGISESTWKRARGVGGDWHKVDIYYLLKFISTHSACSGVALITPEHPEYAAAREQIAEKPIESISICSGSSNARGRSAFPARD